MTGNSDFTHNVIREFAPNSRQISRQSGFDIESAEIKSSIAAMSLEYDIFINHIHSGHFSGQTELLYAVHNEWKDKSKRGLIINTGSFGTYCPPENFQRWTVVKRGLDIANRQCCAEIQNKKLPFRMCNLRIGTIDSQTSRAKPHWPGAGIAATHFADVIKNLYRLPEELLVHEMVFTRKVD